MFAFAQIAGVEGTSRTHNLSCGLLASVTIAINAINRILMNIFRALFPVRDFAKCSKQPFREISVWQLTSRRPKKLFPVEKNYDWMDGG